MLSHMSHLLLVAAVAISVSVSSIVSAEEPTFGIPTPKSCLPFLNDDREIGGDEFWKFEVFYNSKSFGEVKRHVFKFAVDILLERLVWTSTWGEGHEGKLDMRTSELEFKKGKALTKTVLDINSKRWRSTRVLKEIVLHSKAARDRISNEDLKNVLDCFGDLSSGYIITINR